MEQVHGGDIYSHDKAMLDFSANISPLGIQPEILKAASEALVKMSCYPDVKCRRLTEAIALKEQVAQQNIICGNGAAELIFNLILALKPETAMFLAPTFAEYEQAADMIVKDKRFFYLTEDKDFELDDGILDMIREDLDILFLCNPNNPTGKIIEKDLLLRIVEKCEQNGVFLVVDECFLEFTGREKELSLVEITEKYSNLCILKAFTKMYAMPGLRLGYAICSNQSLIEKMHKCRQPWSVSVVAEEAGIAALGLKELPQKTAEYVSEERKYLIRELAGLGIKVFEGEANYLLLKSEIDIEKELLKKDILVRNCDNYRGLTNGYYRIAVKNHDENMRLIQAIKTIETDKNE